MTADAQQIQIMIMSGVDDGTLHIFSSDHNGQLVDGQWLLTIGRREDNDLCLRGDVFVSRQHANLIWRDLCWHLQDINSTNGTYVEDHNDLWINRRVVGRVPLQLGQLFRIGRTWLKLLASE